jgi:predicted DNA-binding protein (UPF0251 family)
VFGTPSVTFFKPRGVPMTELDHVELSLDEFEALRLADLEEKYHQDAAEGMDVSRTTFGRVLSSARGKVADAIVNGKAVIIRHMPEEPERKTDDEPAGSRALAGRRE